MESRHKYSQLVNMELKKRALEIRFIALFIFKLKLLVFDGANNPTIM